MRRRADRPWQRDRLPTLRLVRPVAREAVVSKLPKRVKVGPFRYSVAVGGVEWDQARLASNDPDLVGHADHATLTIAMRPGLVPGAEREVLLHEILHACSNAAGQPLECMSHEEAEENAVRVLAPPLLGVLRDNPAVIAYLTGS